MANIRIFEGNVPGSVPQLQMAKMGHVVDQTFGSAIVAAMVMVSLPGSARETGLSSTMSAI